jgi:hypothetical protein
MSFSRRLFVRGIGAAICVMALSGAAQAGRTVNVPANATLQNAVINAQAGDEIIIAPGTYTCTAVLTIGAANVTIRGSTGNAADVIVQGSGMNVNPGSKAAEGFQIYSTSTTIRDLTVQEYWYHGIHMQPGSSGMVISNVIVRNCGQQQIKGAVTNTNGLIKNCLCELTYMRTNLTNDPRGVDYVGGIDLHGGVNFVVQDTIIRNIQGANGDSDGALFAWDQCVNITFERNLIFGCNRGICFGNSSGGRNGYDVDGGIARNNIVWARTTAGPGAGMTTTPWLYDADCATDVYASRNAKVYNNTFWTDSGSYSRTIRVGAAGSYSNSNVQFKYNIVRGNFQVFTGSNYTSTGDVTGNVAQPNWFVDPANANFHLTKLATGAIDKAVLLPIDVPQDFDKQVRPIGSLPDVGADEFVAADLTGDGHVDISDLMLLAGSWGRTVGQLGYNAAADLNGDNAVDVVDLLILADAWGL